MYLWFNPFNFFGNRERGLALAWVENYKIITIGLSALCILSQQWAGGDMEEWFCGRWEWYLRDLPKSILFHCSAAVLATEPRDSIYLLRPCVSSLPRLRQKNGRRFSERLQWVCFGHLWNFFAWSHRSFLSACLMDGNLLGFSKMHVFKMWDCQKQKKSFFKTIFRQDIQKMKPLLMITTPNFAFRDV